MSFFTLKTGKPIMDEVRDQILHVVYSGALFIAIYYPTNPLTAGILSFGLGFLRELEQHKWAWREVGRQDLFFWGSASLILTVAYTIVEFLQS